MYEYKIVDMMKWCNLIFEVATDIVDIGNIIKKLNIFMVAQLSVRYGGAYIPHCFIGSETRTGLQPLGQKQLE